MYSQKMFTQINKWNVNNVINNKLGWTIGHVMAIRGDIDGAKTCIEYGLKTTKGDKYGWTMIQYFQDLHGINLNQDTKIQDTKTITSEEWDKIKISDAHIVAISGKYEDVIAHLKHDMDAFEKKDSFGNTPLDYLDKLHGDGDYYRHLIEISRELNQ